MQIESFIFGDAVKENPFDTGKLEKLTGYSEYYKARFGVYRLGIRVDVESRVIEFRRVRHRRDIYQKFPQGRLRTILVTKLQGLQGSPSSHRNLFSTVSDSRVGSAHHS